MKLLHAGPLSARFDGVDLRYVRLNGRELVRRVYAAIRDQRWETIPFVVRDLQLQEHADHFGIRYNAETTDPQIRFRWSMQIDGTNEGTVTWRMEGESLTSFLKNRIGLCVLHPIDSCAGEPCVIEHCDGSIEQSTYPARVAPHQPFRDVRAILQKLELGTEFELRFEGEEFETEDQRNWTDASFKTYSTPLSRPLPVRVEAGDPVAQTISFRLTRRVAITVAEVVGKVPSLGLQAGAAPLVSTAAAKLQELKLSHLRADLDLSDPDWQLRLECAGSQARSLGCGLELALFGAGEADDLWGTLENLPILRTLTSDPSVRAYGARIVGTNANFVELNRQPPMLADADGVCFSLNPQVHSTDDNTLVENLAAQKQAVESAHALFNGLPVVVTPVTLRPRSAAPDARQQTPFGAVWTLGSLKHLAEAGAEAVTYYETTGPLGVLDENGMEYPMFGVFLQLAGHAGAPVLLCRSSDPLRAEGFAIAQKNRVRVLLPNYQPEPVDVIVEYLDETRTARIPGHSWDTVEFEHKSL